MILNFTLISVILFSFILGVAEGSEFLTIDPKTKLNIFDLNSFPGDTIGYKIINIGDLNGDGTEDLATIAFNSNYGYVKDNDSDESNNYGAIIILFMNSKGEVESSNRITLDDESNGLGKQCLDDPFRGGSNNDIFARNAQSLESITFLGNFTNDNPTLAIGYPGGDFRGDDSNSGDVLLVELANNGDVLSCNKLTQISGFSNNGSISEESSFGTPIITTDINSDGNLDLIVGNEGHLIFPEENAYVTDLLFFLFDGQQNIIDTSALRGEFFGMTKYHMGLKSGYSIDGHLKIVVSSADDIGGDNILYIITLNDGPLYEAVYEIDADTLTPFGFTIDVQANSPYGNNELDPDDNSDGESDAFGYDIYSLKDIDGDGNEDLIVGAFNDDTPVTNAGSIYFLLLNADDSIKDAYKLSNPNITSDDSFGHAITSFQSNNKTWLAVGAPNDDTLGENSGIIYIYDLDDFPFFPKTGNEEDEAPPEVDNDPENDPIIILTADSDPQSPSDAKIWLTTKNEFVDGFNHLIITGEIQGQRISSSNNVPEWIMTFLGETWYNDQISDTEFYGALQYLFDEGIIK